jgi:hypothetical protein
MRAALASDGHEKYLRGRSWTRVEPRIRELLAPYPTMLAAVIAELIGWTRSIRMPRDGVAKLRPVHLPANAASCTSYVAGEIARCDLGLPPIMLPVGSRPNQPRWQAALLIPSWKAEAEDMFEGDHHHRPGGSRAAVTPR